MRGSTRIRGMVVLGLLLAVVGSGGGLTASAVAVRTPGVSVSPGAGAPGTVVQVDGKRYPQGERGQVVLEPGGMVLGAVQTARSGAFAVTVEVPAVSAGRYTVVATVAGSSAQAPFEVTGTSEGPREEPVAPTATAIPATEPAAPTATATEPVGPVVLQFGAVADARVEAANPDVNYGSEAALLVDGTPEMETNLRFAVSGVQGAVERATLWVYAYDGSIDGPAVYGTTAEWSERAVTWASRPVRTSAAVADLGEVTAETWVGLDVTALVTADGNYGFVLAATSSDGVDLWSREAGTSGPWLEVTVGSGQPGPTPTAVVAPPTATSEPATPTATPAASATPTATEDSTSSGGVFYVDSVGGDDANSGTSESTAWRSLAKASAASLAPGNQLLFKRGATWSGSLKISASGTGAEPVVIGAYGSGSLPVIRGGGSCVVLSGSSIVVREIHVDGCSWAGIDVAGSSNLIEHSLVTGNAAGIHVRSGASNNRIISNELRDNNRMSVLTQGGDDDSGAFAILLQGDGTEVGNNTVSGSDAFSYDYGRDGSAIEVYGATGSYIHHNLAVNNQTFAELGNSRSADNTFAYNVVRSSLTTSMFLVTRGASSGWGPVLRTTLYNNTAVLTGSSSQGFVCHGGCSPDVLTMRNNIIQAVAKVGYADAPFDEDFNLYYGGQAQFTLGANSMIADPRFANPAGGDLRLTSGSPAIDGGIGVGYSVDFDGTAVPIDGNRDGIADPDIGAFEFAG